MKKMLLALGLILSLCFGAKAQIMTITNNSSCTVDYIVWAIDQGGSCRGASYYIGINVIVGAGGSVTLNASNPFIWNGTVPAGPISWAGINIYCHLPNTSCHHYGGTGCYYDQMSLGGVCNPVTSACMTISDACSVCPPMTVVNATWGPGVNPGDAAVTIN
jgi:hypothetical protein